MNKCIAFVFAIVLSMALTACTATVEEPPSSVTEQTQSTATDLKDNEYRQTTSSDVKTVESEKEKKPETPASVRELMENNEEAHILQEQVKKMEPEHMSLSLEATENALIYTFTYNEELGVKANDVREPMKAAIGVENGLGDGMSALAKKLQALTTVKDPVVVLKLYDSFGEEILTEEFRAPASGLDVTSK